MFCPRARGEHRCVLLIFAAKPQKVLANRIVSSEASFPMCTSPPVLAPPRQCWLLTHTHTCTLTVLAARIFSWGRVWLQSRASPGRSGVQAACGSCYRNGSLARQVPDSRTRKHTYREAVWGPGGSVDPGLGERPGFSPDPAKARVPLGKSLH